MRAISKKKKVYIVRESRGKKNLLPIVAGAAILAYFLFFRKTDTTTTQTTAPLPAPGAGPVLSSNPNPVIVDSGGGTGTQVIQPTPVSVTPGANLPAVSTTAFTDRQVLMRDAAEDPALSAALTQMSSQEILDTYQYFYSYYLPGITLYRYPDPSHPSQWNTALYDAVQVLRAKYHIF